MELTHFQKTVKRALGLPGDVAQTVQVGWPNTSEELEDILFAWNDGLSDGVPGIQLLAACSVVWARKPSDPSQMEGRAVLYHPVTGSAIPVGSPLDGLTWEMLAFLSWANRAGRLPWNDEVTIAREAKVAGSSIYKLPADRFYAKNSLPMQSSMPRGADKSIDWTDVGLAEAKRFVTSGGRSEPSKNEPPIYVEDGLVGVLGSIPALRSSDARDRLLRGLPPGPCGAIGRSNAPSTDLFNIVVAAEEFGRLADGKIAINVVIENAQRFVRGTALEHKLKEFVV